MVDEVESSRGFAPPVFVDIRHSRGGRAEGFQGKSFEQVVGSDRYRWLKSLGNRAIEDHTGPRIQIDNPAAAEELLDLAVSLSRQKRRLLFYCACQSPRRGGEITCHRTVVGDLLLQAARARSIDLDVTEWPGGQPGDLRLQVEPDIVEGVLRDRKYMPLDGSVPLSQAGGLGSGSRVFLFSSGGDVVTLVEPARFQRRWVLPVVNYWTLPLHEHDDPPNLQEESRAFRRDRGMEPRSSLPGGQEAANSGSRTPALSPRTRSRPSAPQRKDSPEADRPGPARKYK
jgi:hypothetical protein